MDCRNSFIRSVSNHYARIIIFCLSRSSRNTLRLISSTASNPSFPFAAFSRNLVTVASSIEFLIFCHPPQTAVIFASCTNCVRAAENGWYTTVSWTLIILANVRFVEHIVTFFDAGSTYEVSKTCEVSLPPMMDNNHFGALCLQVMRRSVRRMPVSGSIRRDKVSTAITCVDLSFHGQYFRQFAVETSSQE